MRREWAGRRRRALGVARRCGCLPASPAPAHPPRHLLHPANPPTAAPSRQEKAAWQKQQRSLEAAADKARRAAEEARERLAEQEAALKAVGAERRASQQDRWVWVWVQVGSACGEGPRAQGSTRHCRLGPCEPRLLNCPCRRQAEAEAKAREAKLAAALEEAQRLRGALEEARGAQAARAGAGREEATRLAADNRQLTAQVRGALGGHQLRDEAYEHCAPCMPKP